KTGGTAVQRARNPHGKCRVAGSRQLVPRLPEGVAGTGSRPECSKDLEGPTAVANRCRPGCAGEGRSDPAPFQHPEDSQIRGSSRDGPSGFPGPVERGEDLEQGRVQLPHAPTDVSGPR